MSKLTDLMNERLNEKFGGNATELARVVGTTQQNISNFLSGKVSKPHYWKEVARALDIDLKLMEELMKGDGWVPVSWDAILSRATRGEEFFPPNGLIQPHVDIKPSNKLVPVLGEAVGGADGKYIFNGSILDYVACPPSLASVPNAYAVFIDGESMSPRYKPGETVWVHPNKPARRGDDVIVQVHPVDDDGSPPYGYVKEFVGWTSNKLRLRQHNPDSQIEFERDEVVSVHPIVLSGKY